MNNSPQEMQPIHTAYGLPEAELLRSYLAASGIEVELAPAGAGVAFGFTLGPLGRVEIFVAANRAAEAKELIAHAMADDDAQSSTEPATPTAPTDRPDRARHGGRRRTAAYGTCNANHAHGLT